MASDSTSLLDQVILSVGLALSAWGIFAFLTSIVFAVLFGPERGPRFIRAASYLYTRPTSGLEWFGLVVAILITAASQLTVVASALSFSEQLGSLGVVLLWLELWAAAAWLGYLTWRYLRARSTRL